MRFAELSRRTVAPCLAWLAWSVPALAQVGGRSVYEAQYGTPVSVELSDLDNMGESYDRRNVKTRGYLGTLGARNYYSLEDRGARVLLLAMRGMGPGEIDGLLGRIVEVKGVVRALKPCESPCPMGPCSMCRDPDLPPLPEPSFELPRVSISFYDLVDITEDETKKRVERERSTLEALIKKPGSKDGEVVRVIGQFRGQNLYGDLPVASRRTPTDWVIKDDDYAIWITGKRPKGSGWELDPSLKRDTGKWIEVVGKPETVKGVTYLRAQQMALTVKPTPVAAAKDAPPPPERPKVPPVVVFALPLDGDREVPRDARFAVQFSKDMDRDSFQGRVVLRYAGPQRPGERLLDNISFRYDDGKKALVVDPGDALRPGRTIELLLLPGIADVDGLELTPRPGKVIEGAVDVLRFQVGT